LNCIIKNYARFRCEIKARVATAKRPFSWKKIRFTSKLDLYLRKKLVKCFIWNTALYGAKTWTLTYNKKK
jgi:hypothetical protein